METTPDPRYQVTFEPPTVPIDQVVQPRTNTALPITVVGSIGAAVLLLGMAGFFGYRYFRTNQNDSNKAGSIVTVSENQPTPLPESKFANTLMTTTSPSVAPTSSPKASLKPTPTARPTPKPSPKPVNYNELIVLEKTSVDLEAQFGEIRQASINLENKSDKKIDWIVTKKTCDTNGAGCPVDLKSSPSNIYTELEANQTGRIVFEGTPFSSNPRIEAVFELSFFDMSSPHQKPLTVKTIKVNLLSPVRSEVLVETNYDDRNVGDQNLTLSFKPRYLTPIIIKNRHTYGVRWSCKYVDTSVASQIQYGCGTDSWWLPGGDGWHTDLQFKDEYSGPSNFQIEFTFSDSQNKVVETKLLTVQVNK